MIRTMNWKILFAADTTRDMAWRDAVASGIAAALEHRPDTENWQIKIARSEEKKGHFAALVMLNGERLNAVDGPELPVVPDDAAARPKDLEAFWRDHMGFWLISLLKGR
jgi:hypothetical protein